MQHHIDQAKHNGTFHNCIEENFPGQFCDWKITVLFYTAIHYLKALAASKNIEIGDTHYDIENSVNPDRTGHVMPITKNAWREYRGLLEYSRTARYTGITDVETFEKLKAIDHQNCLKHLDNFKKYIVGRGVAVD